MKIFTAPIYFLLFLLISTSGCKCKGDDEYVPYSYSCEQIEKISKNFTFEIHAKYKHNNEPIQGEGRVAVIADWDNYVLVEILTNDCHYEIHHTKDTFKESFDEFGKAIIKLPAYEYDDKHDNITFSIFVYFPFSSDEDQFMNSKYTTGWYNSSEEIVLSFSYLSRLEL